ncbi:MAG: hypothetical protein ACKVP4_00755 [Hyphomicrobium sp.]
MTSYNHIAKIIAVNALVFAIGIVIVELVFGTWFQETSALYQFTQSRNVKLVRKSPVPGDDRIATYTRDNYGFRGLDGDVADIDIITVGGSTTDQRYLDDGATYQAVLKARFAADGRKLVIANAGIDGQSTIGHIKNFASWFDRIQGLHTRYILYYVGINDVLRLKADETYDRLAVDSPKLRFQLYVRDKSVFYQLYLIAKQWVTPHPLMHSIDRKYIAVGEALVSTPLIQNLDTPNVRTMLEQLNSRIRELDALTRARGAKSIFVSQRSARWDRRDGKLLGIAKYDIGPDSEFSPLGPVNGVDIYNVERLVASSIMQTCKEVDAICIDLMDEIQFDLSTDFYDPVHTTESGSKVIGKYLHDRLRDRIH